MIPRKRTPARANSGPIARRETAARQTAAPSLLDGLQVPLSRPPHCGPAILLDHHVPKRSENSFGLVWHHRLNDAINGCCRKRYVVRVAVHEADVFPVGHDLDDVAGEQSTSSLCAARPMAVC